MERIVMEPGAKRVVEALIYAGYDAYAVGGCVRDALLGDVPNDWDVCTSALPEQTIAVFGEENCIPTGLKHGTVTVKMDGGLYEVTTFRTEGTYSDGRHPDSVDFVSDVRDDLSRRDFTINAMAYNDRMGLIDPFGGREDLFEHRILRAVGEPMKRFSEDALRIMRLFRFAARFSFAIEEETSRAAIALCQNLRLVSGERIREELMKLLSANKPGEYLPREIACVILGGMDREKCAAYEHMTSALDALAPDAELRLAALLSFAEDAGAVLEALRCSNKTAQRVNTAIALARSALPEEDAALRIWAKRTLGAHGLSALEDAAALSGVLCGEEAGRKRDRCVFYAREAKEKGLCCSLKALAV
ncbi:MAG: tRNA nucleotidyltransferase, partial [Clostridia bacterium]|nr:tRNA nucleotidyltransferase [Clostridia bacterium]